MEVKESNIKFQFDQTGIQGISSDFFPANFLMCIIGKPGSGKTTLLRKLLLDSDLLSKKFDYILIITPSPQEFPFIINDKQIVTQFDLNWITKLLYSLKNVKNVLIIIDDFISWIKKEENNPLLRQLIFNRRHIVKNATVSIIMTSQRYITIPATIRSCINMLIVFKLSFKDMSKIYDELITCFRSVWRIIISQMSHFLMINVDSQEFFLDFDKVVVS